MIRLESSINFGFKLSTWKPKENEENETFFFFLRNQTWKSQFPIVASFFWGMVVVEVRPRSNREEVGPELWKWSIGWASLHWELVWDGGDQPLFWGS